MSTAAMIETTDDANTTELPALGFRLLVGLLALVAAGKAVLFDTLDPDSFIHLLSADQMLREGIGPIVDRYSFASLQTPWTPYSWLGALAMKVIWDFGGYRAAVAVHALMAAGIVTLVALACRTAAGMLDGTPRFPRFASDDAPVDGTGLRCVVATTFAAILSLAYLSFRPVTMAILGLALVSLLLLRDRRDGERTWGAWCVIPLTALLINLHPFAVIVPMWIGALLVGALWERRRVALPPDWPEADRRVRRYEVLLVGTFCACMATPMLPGVLQSVFQLNFADPMVKGPVVAEYQPFYRGGAGMIAVLLVGTCLACLVVKRKLLRVGEVCWLLIGLALLLRMGRLSPVFALSAAPFFAACLPRLSDRVIGRPVVCAAVAATLLLGLMRVLWSFPTASEPMDAWANRHGPDAPGYPCGAAAYVESRITPKLGRVINEYTWGGYLEWRLTPRFQMLLDGRTTVYSREFWQATYLGSDIDRLRFFANVRADAAILPVERSTFHDALSALGWTTVYRDERAEVLVPPTQAVSETKRPDWGGFASLLFAE